MMILDERYDEFYWLDEYDDYDPFDGETYCDIYECSDCPRCGDDCDGEWEDENDETE